MIRFAAVRKLRRFLRNISNSGEVGRLPGQREIAAVDIPTMEVCRKIRVKQCDDPPRVAFLIYTYTPNHRSRCRTQYATWGSRAGSGVFYFSDGLDDTLPVVNLGFEGPESYNNMWRKTTSMLRYAWLRLSKQYDWFMVGGDDLYVIIDNLLNYLTLDEIRDQQCNGNPLYLGRRFRRPGEEFTYNSGGAGYLLNKQALEAFIDTVPAYQEMTFAEDVMVGRTMYQAGIDPFDTRDPTGAERFFPFTPRLHYDYRKRNAAVDDWFAAYTRDFELIEGLEGISKESVSFHYVDPNLMTGLDGLFYPTSD